MHRSAGGSNHIAIVSRRESVDRQINLSTSSVFNLVGVQITLAKLGFACCTCVLEMCKAANADVTDVFPYCPKTEMHTVCLFSNCSQILRSALAATLAAGIAIEDLSPS